LCVGANVPLFRTKKEPFEWLKTGKKTIDVRKGILVQGQIAVYLSGRKVLRLKIVSCETGGLREIVRSDNYKMIIPSATTVDEAISYIKILYPKYEGLFTAYRIEPGIYEKSRRCN
jgi:ASC-1-like (ASCH) protein